MQHGFDETDTVGKYVDSLQSSGRYCFTTRDVMVAQGTSAGSLQASLRRLKKKGRITSPRRGFFVIIPLEYRSAKSPPASWFIDDLMAYFGQEYYVGLLTAAGIYGASHQQPQVFQVVTDLPTRSVNMDRVQIQFHRNRRMAEVPVKRVKTETGTMCVSTPEATALDLVRYPVACGSLNNVVTVLSELSESMRPAALRKAAGRARHPDVQRLGYLLDQLALPALAKPLEGLVKSWRKRSVHLRPDRDAGDLEPDLKWYVIPNEGLKPEV